MRDCTKKIGFGLAIILCLTKTTYANTYEWVGLGANSDWTTTANWVVIGGTYPQAGDIANIGVNFTYSNYPVVTGTQACASVVFGNQQATNSLTVNGTLTVGGTISSNAAGFATIPSLTDSYLYGTGSASCTGINVGVGTFTGSKTSFLHSELKTLTVNGDVNIKLNSTTGSGIGFTLNNGTMTLSGQIVFNSSTTSTAANAAYFAVNGKNGAGVASNPTLSLGNANAIATLPAQVGGFNIATVNFNGNRTLGSSGKITIIYTGASPTVYTSALVGFGTGGGTINTTPPYDNLTVAGTGTAKIGTGAGTLMLDSILTTSSPTTFASFTTTTTVGTRWINSSTITGGAGATTLGTSLNNSGTMNMAAGNLTTGTFFNNSGTASFAAGNLTIGTNYVNTGTFTQTAATSDPGQTTPTNTTFFAGTTPALSNTNAGNTTTFNNLVFSGTAATPTMSGSGKFIISSLGVLLLKTANTTLTTGGTLTLNSDVNGTASVAALPSGGIVTGNVDVQRFITGGALNYRGYRLLASPVNISSNTGGGGNIGLTYFTAGTGVLTGGPGGAANGFTVNNPNPTVYLYDESRTSSSASFVAGKNAGVVAITGATGVPPYNINVLSGTTTTTGLNVPVGNGVLLYFIGNNASTVTSPSRVPENTTITATGYLNQGNITVKNWKTGLTSLQYTTGTGAPTPGFNQIANPYASVINLDQVYADNSALSPVFWELNEPGQTYISYNASTHAVSNTRASKYIASGQGFFVNATTTGQTITFKEGQKVLNQLTGSTTPPLLMGLPKSIPLAGLHLQLTQDKNNYTQCGIYFNSSWTDKYNKKEDALDLDGPAIKVYMSSFSTDNYRTSINQLADYKKGKRIKLFVKANTSGLYHMDLVDAKNMDTVNYKIFLIDHYKKDSLDMGRYKSYNFNIVTTDTTTFGAKRFELAINSRIIKARDVPAIAAALTGKKTDNGVQLSWTANELSGPLQFSLEKQQATFNDFKLLYQTKSGADYSYTDKAPNNGNNVYRVKITDQDYNVTYSNSVSIFFNAAGNNNSFTVYPNPTAANINVNITTNTNADVAAQPSYSMNIYNAAGILVSRKTAAERTMSQNVSQYQPGVYIIEVKNGNGLALGKAKFLKLK